MKSLLMERNAPDTGAEDMEPGTDGIGPKTAGLGLKTRGLGDGSSRHDSFFPWQCCGVFDVTPSGALCFAFKQKEKRKREFSRERRDGVCMYRFKHVSVNMCWSLCSWTYKEQKIDVFGKVKSYVIPIQSSIANSKKLQTTIQDWFVGLARRNIYSEFQ